MKEADVRGFNHLEPVVVRVRFERVIVEVAAGYAVQLDGRWIRPLPPGGPR